MKKFLSLVLAMIMTLSLVTISAGATEYKDFADKGEIQYEEAVAVLNKIGIITGYDDGTFRPETELTRGAAAKIIVSLMIGSDAATALSNNTSPYPDVPSGYTFAGVISYCKTKEYISGYGDGTFRPGDTLTGFAFAKMLLGALGYSSEIERFTGYGWTNNVANIGNVAGLFDRLEFDGSAAVTREQACQLALNTLKATTVTYGGSTIINGANGSYTMQGTTATQRTSNNRDINANIGRKDWYGGNNKASDYLTLEFGEEHFKDLRLEHDRYDPAHDDFGRPSNEWSYKKVTIGTFPLEADYTYTTQVAHVEDTDGTKEKNLGLKNFDLVADGGYSYWTGWGNDGIGSSTYGGHTTLWLNGKEDYDFFAQSSSSTANNKKVANIADFTDNGTLVEVYVSALDADWITDVVVVQTQLMEVKKVGSDYVSLDRQDPDVADEATQNARPNGEPYVGYNFAAIDVNVENVKDTDEECYDILKGLKAGDKIAVIPVTTDDGKTYEAAEVYVPETVSGAWTRVDTYGNARVNVEADADSRRSAISLTVGGTTYKIADWHKDMYDTTDKDVKATRSDVTLYMDKYGNALLAKGIGDTSDFMVIGNFYQSLVNGKICTFVHGWDISGEEIDLNLGSNLKMVNHGETAVAYGHELGELVKYDSGAATGDADYALIHTDVHSVFYLLNDADKVTDAATATFEIKANNVRLPVADGINYSDADNKAAHFCDQVRMTNAANAHIGEGFAASTLGTRYDYAKDVKFVYVNYNRDDAEVDSVEFKTGRQNVSNEELQKLCDTTEFIYASQAALKDNEIKAVVIKQESADANLNNLLYVVDHTGYKEYDSATGRSYFGVLVAMFTADGKFENPVELIIDKDLEIGAFATYNKLADEKVENYYHVKSFTRHNTNPSALIVDNLAAVTRVNSNKYSKSLLALVPNASGYIYSITADGRKGNALVADPLDDGKDAIDTQHSYVMSKWRSHGDLIDEDINYVDVYGYIWANKAEWLNMTDERAYDDIDSVEDLTELLDKGYSVQATVLLNEKPDSDGFRTAYLIIINQVKGGGTTTTNHTTIGPITFEGGVRGEDWTTDATATMKVGSSFRVTLLNGAEIDWANTQGVRYDGNNGSGTYYFVITNTPVVIPIITKKADTINVKVDGPTGDTAATVTFAYSGKTVTAKINETVTLPKGENVTVSVAPAADYTVSPTTFTATADRVVTVAKNTVPGETVIVTVAENAAASVTFTYEGKTETVAPGGSITVTKNAEVTATVDAGFHLDNDQTSYTFTAALNSTINVYKDVAPGEKVTVTIVVGEEATGAAFDVSGHTTAGSFEIEAGTALVVPNIPTDNDTKPYRAIVGFDATGKEIKADGYVVNADTTVYIQRGKFTLIFAGNDKFDPNGPAMQGYYEYPALPAAASLHSIGGLKAKMVVYAMSSEWVSVGFYEMELCGAKTLAEMFQNTVTGAIGFDVPATKIGENDATLAEISAAVDKTVSGDGEVTIALNNANRGFVNVDGAAVALPAENGDLLVNVNEDADGNVTITEKEGHEGEFTINGEPIGPDPVPVTKDSVVSEAHPVEKVSVTVNFENATVMNGTTAVTSGVAFQVEKGSDVTLTITANEGYVLQEVKVGSIAKTVAEDGTLALGKVNADTTVTVTTISKAQNALPFQIEIPAQTAYAIGSSGPKVSALQKNDVKVTYDDETHTFKFTGTLLYKENFTEYTSGETLKNGYYMTMVVDLSGKTSDVTELSISALKSTDPSELDATRRDITAEDGGTTRRLTAFVAGTDGTLSAQRGILVKWIDDNSIYYKLDFSGLTLEAPELMVISEADTNKTFADKKVSAIQDNVTVAVTGTDTAKTVKVSGTVKYQATNWDGFGTSPYGTGYIAAIHMDWSALSTTSVRAFNSLGKDSGSGSSAGADITKVDVKDGESDKKGVMLMRVGDAAGKKADIKLIVSNAGKVITYTFDFTDLTLETPTLGVTVPTGETTTFTKKVSVLQSGVKVNQDKQNETYFTVTGKAYPVAGWNEYATNNDRAQYRNGYYVALKIDTTTLGSDVTIKYTHSDGYPGVDLKGNDYVITTRIAGLDGVRTLENVVLTGTNGKTYTINFSGVELEPIVKVSGAAPNQELFKKGADASAVTHVASEIQEGIKAVLDETAKTITLTGTVYRTYLKKFSESKPELDNGIFVAINISSGAGMNGNIFAQSENTEGDGVALNLTTGMDILTIRVGDLSMTEGSELRSDFKIVVKGGAEYTIITTGLTVAEATTSNSAAANELAAMDAPAEAADAIEEPEDIVEPAAEVEPEADGGTIPEDDGETVMDEGEVLSMDPGAAE